MKKLNLLITLLICITASAQSNQAFGIKAGANYAKFRSDSDIYKGKIGYYIGGFFNFGLSDRIGVRLELLLANQGTKASYEVQDPENFGDIGNFEANWNELTILLPISFRYELVEGLYIEVGPQAGYAVKRTHVIKKFSFYPELEGQKYEYSDFDRFDVALNGGIGVDLTDQLELQCRYSYGVIERDNYYKTSVVSVGLGFKL